MNGVGVREYNQNISVNQNKMALPAVQFRSNNLFHVFHAWMNGSERPHIKAQKAQLLKSEQMISVHSFTRTGSFWDN